MPQDEVRSPTGDPALSGARAEAWMRKAPLCELPAAGLRGVANLREQTNPEHLSR